MSKRKILMLAVSMCMVAILAVGGTLAYLTDTDNETNVFTTGKVDIDLEETFVQNSKLLPGIQNAVQKEVWIELEPGSEDAYVWYEMLIPAALDSIDGSTGLNNIVHVNSYGRTWDKYSEDEKYWAEGQTEPLPWNQTWDHDANVELEALVGPEGYIGTETIDGIVYNVYVVLYHGKLTNESTNESPAVTKTTPAMSQVYLDAGVDFVPATEDVEAHYIDKNGNMINFDFSKNINILVRAYAIQADGFADVYEAYTAYQAQAE